MKSYSVDLRRRVLAACDAGATTLIVAKRFSVSPAWVRRVKQRRRENNELVARPSGGDRRSKFNAKAMQRLADQVARHPDMTLAQLRDWAAEALAIQCSLMAVCRTLKRVGLTLKKNASRQ